MQILKRSVNNQYVYVYMVDATDGYTPKTSITSPLIYISANGASATVPSDGNWAAIHASNMPGWYRVRLNATDTSVVGPLGIDVFSTGTRHFATVVQVVPSFFDDIKTDTTSIYTHVSSSGVAINIASIADAVWDEQISGHLASGSTGAKLNAATAAADPWSANPASYTDPTTFGWAIGRVIGGSGRTSATVNVQDADDNPVEGVRVDVYNAATPTTANYVTTGVTDTGGNVTFYLFAGTYYLFRYKRGYSFVDPVTLVVTA